VVPTRVCDTIETTLVVSQRDESGSQRTVESESYEAVFQSSDEIDQSEPGAEGRFVETYEVLLCGSDKVRSVSQEIEESVFPEGSLERDAAVGGVFGDNASEIVVVEGAGEQLKIALFVRGPGLVLSLAEDEKLVSGALEVDLIMKGLDELGEVAMNVAQIERGPRKLVGDHGSGTTNSRGIKGREVSPEGAIRVVLEEVEALEDGVEEIER